MDLIDKITNVLQREGFSPALIELRYDDERNIVGYIVDPKFTKLNDLEAQKVIWEPLKKNLDMHEINRIVALYHETPEDKVVRLTKEYPPISKMSNYWRHRTPDLSTYWIFIDVAKFGDEYRCFYMIINSKSSFSKASIFTYPPDVLSFMELVEEEEIHEELLLGTLNNAESEIKFHLMEQYERLTHSGLVGRQNIYYYVYERFQMEPLKGSQLIFSLDEVRAIEKFLSKMEGFPLKKQIEKAINVAMRINKDFR